MLHIYRKIFGLLTPRERRRFLLILLLIMVMGLFDMVGVASILPFLAVAADPGLARQNQLVAYLYDLAGYESDHAFLIFLGGMVLCLLITGFIVKTATLFVLSRFSQMRYHSIAMRLLTSYLGQPYPWFLGEHSTKLAQAVLGQIGTVINSAIIPAMRIIAQGVSVLFLIGLLVVLQPVVAASTAIVLGGVYGMIFLFFRRRLSRIGKEQILANQARFRIAQEALAGIKDVKLLGIEERFARQFSVPSRHAAELSSKLMLIGELPRYLLETVAFAGMVLVVLMMLVVRNADLSSILPVLGVFAFAGMRMFPALQLIYYSLTQLRSGGPALDQIHADLQKLSMPERPVRRQDVPPMTIAAGIELGGIGFAYAGTERQTLNGLDLRVPACTTVGIVGGSGAGKTSAVDVILGLLVPQSGTLKVDGVPVTDANRRAWQNALGYVPQQIFLTDDSVAGNIAFGLPSEERDQAAIERAARIANLHDFVMSELPQGYQTPVGERGVRLSGGQRQRIGIARALYHDPAVLILDEATSALDNLTERAVMEAVHALGHKKTIIMIAHRLTTVKDCDRIFLMEAGRVVDEGTYEELVAGNETFRQMANG